MKQSNPLKQNPVFCFVSNLWASVVNILNSFLYTEPKKEKLGTSKEDIIALRREVSNTLFDVLSGNRTVLDVVSKFPKDTTDESVNVCFHILVHLEADEDIRLKDPLYREEQDEFILYIAELLQNGENIPINIIKEYNGFYGETLVYPEMNKKNIIARLKKFINI